jgi:RHH-type rel operon transcriptional repressor/antitoxin RelB
MPKNISIRLDDEILHQLDFYAKELERSRSYLIKKAITNYFDKLDEMISDERLDRLKKGEANPVSMEEVFKKAGIKIDV